MKGIKTYLERKRIEKKKKQQRLQVESEWQGYEAEVVNNCDTMEVI